MSKIIDLVPFLKTINTNRLRPGSGLNGSFDDAPTSTDSPSAEIVNFQEKKQSILFHERRYVQRTILTEFISSMVVLPEKGLLKVSIHDISDEGISFDMDETNGRFRIGEEISLRIYLNQKAYFPIQLTVRHVTPDLDEGVVRHGAVYLKNEDNHVALQHFVRFIESASVGLRKDSGDLIATRTS